MPRLFPPILPLSRHANAHAPKSEHLVPRAVGLFADNPQRCLTSGDKGRPDVPCQATGLSPSQDEFPETYTETNKHAKYPGETKRGGRRATTAPECLRRTAKRRLSDPGQPLPTDMMLGYADLVHPAAGVERFELRAYLAVLVLAMAADVFRHHVELRRGDV